MIRGCTCHHQTQEQRRYKNSQRRLPIHVNFKPADSRAWHARTGFRYSRYSPERLRALRYRESLLSETLNEYRISQVEPGRACAPGQFPRTLPSPIDLKPSTATLITENTGVHLSGLGVKKRPLCFDKQHRSKPWQPVVHRTSASSGRTGSSESTGTGYGHTD